jgi:NarL family two-component system response regulator LiaR
MATNGSIRVLVADDHPIVRKGIRALLATEPDIEVVGEARDGREAIVQAQRLRPDVVVMDLSMPTMGGVEAIRHIIARQPETRVLVLTYLAGNSQLFSALEAGALGYLLKDAALDELVQGIRRVYHGEPALHPIATRRLLHRVFHSSGPPSAQDALTERELEVLQWIARGKSNREIAEQLTISETTVRGHVSNILAKLHLSSRTQAALYALREGLAALASPEDEGELIPA